MSGIGRIRTVSGPDLRGTLPAYSTTSGRVSPSGRVSQWATGEQRAKQGRSTRQQLQATRGFSLSHPAHRRPPSQRLRTGLRRTVLPVIDRLGRDTDQATVVASRQAKTVTVGSHPLRREANAFGGAGLRHCGEPALLLLLEESLAACEYSDLAFERGDGQTLLSNGFLQRSDLLLDLSTGQASDLLPQTAATSGMQALLWAELSSDRGFIG